MKYAIYSDMNNNTTGVTSPCTTVTFNKLPTSRDPAGDVCRPTGDDDDEIAVLAQ